MEHRSLSAGWLTRIQTVFRNALALCQAAHLSNLKAFDKKIADLCLTQPDPNLGLRTVNTQELLSADRRLWAAISREHELMPALLRSQNGKRCGPGWPSSGYRVRFRRSAVDSATPSRSAAPACGGPSLRADERGVAAQGFSPLRGPVDDQGRPRG